MLAEIGFISVVLSFAGIYAVAALGLQLHVGHAGLLNFGQVGYMAISAYTVAIALKFELPLAGAIGLSLLTPIVAAIIIGSVTLRLRTDFLAITAIAAAEIIRLFALNMTDLTNGPSGIDAGSEFKSAITRPILRYSREIDYELDRALPLLVIIWIVVALSYLLLRHVTRGPWGLVLRAVREDEDAARALGKNAFLYKMQALSLGAMVGGAAGTLYGLYVIEISPLSFEPIVTFITFVVIILGGSGSFGGTIIAAVIVQSLLEGTRFLDTPLTNSQEASMRFIIVGVILMLLVAFRPQGLFGNRREMVLDDT